MSSSSEPEEMQAETSDEEITGNAGGLSDNDTDEDGESEAGEPETENSDEIPRTAPAVAMDASSTESDADASGDDEVDDDEDVPQPKVEKQRAKIEKISQELLDTYSKRRGKQLYIRFPEKLPEDPAEFEAKVKACSDLIVVVHKPRQKHARFCLVDFATTEDRDKTLKKLKKNEADNKLIVSLPRTEDEEFIKTLAERKVKAIEHRREQLYLKKQAKKLTKTKEFTSSILVYNVPKSASIAQIKELFPDAVDIQLTDATKKQHKTSNATITLPSPMDAKASCKKKLTLGGNKLFIRFNNKNRNKKPGSENTKDGVKVPANGNKQKKNKKKNKLAQKKPVESENQADLDQKKPNEKKSKGPPAKKFEMGESVDVAEALKKSKSKPQNKKKLGPVVTPQKKTPGLAAPPQNKKTGLEAPKKNGIQKNKLKKKPQNKAKAAAM